MKKSIMSKRGRRFESGGEVEDKAAGLEASNKEAPMGFFERLRAGNIDDPNSEAYKRLGAGRGAAERIPVEDRIPTAVEIPKITSRSEGMGNTYASVQARKNAETEGEKITEGERIAQEMASKPDRVVEPTKVVKKPATKDTSSYSNEGRYKPPVGTSTVKDTGHYSNEGKGKEAPSVKTETKSESKNAPIDETKLSLSERIKLSREKSKSGSKTDSRSANERIRSAFGFKDGGSVGKASSRADGIAQRGKTRGVMR
jgi:hypothetical protein